MVIQESSFKEHLRRSVVHERDVGEIDLVEGSHGIPDELHYILNTIPRNSHGWFWPFPRMVSIFSDSRQWSPLLGIPPNRLLAILPTPAAPPFYPSFLSISKHFRLCRTYFYLETLTSDGQTQLIHRLAFDDQCRTLASILLYTVPVPDCTRIRYTIRLKIIHPGLF